jgi:Holliday junction resolvasome RuvABC endonuclease subunit
MVQVTGLDLSMTQTGICHTVEGAACWHVLKPKKVKDARLPEIVDQVLEYVTGADLVLIEMLPPNMKGAGITGMVQGIVRLELQRAGIPYGDIGPSSLKKYATGKGGASKTEMALAALTRGQAEISNDNACDAWWAWVMAADHLGSPVFPLPKLNRTMLDNIEMKG